MNDFDHIFIFDPKKMVGKTDYFYKINYRKVYIIDVPIAIFQLGSIDGKDLKKLYTKFSNSEKDIYPFGGKLAFNTKEFSIMNKYSYKTHHLSEPMRLEEIIRQYSPMGSKVLITYIGILFKNYNKSKFERKNMRLFQPHIKNVIDDNKEYTEDVIKYGKLIYFSFHGAYPKKEVFKLKFIKQLVIYGEPGMLRYYMDDVKIPSTIHNIRDLNAAAKNDYRFKIYKEGDYVPEYLLSHSGDLGQNVVELSKKSNLRKTTLMGQYLLSELLSDLAMRRRMDVHTLVFSFCQGVNNRTKKELKSIISKQKRKKLSIPDDDEGHSMMTRKRVKKWSSSKNSSSGKISVNVGSSSSKKKFKSSSKSK